MTASQYTLLLPGKLSKASEELFATQVVLAAESASIAVDIKSEKEFTPEEAALAKSYGLPLLKAGPVHGVIFQGLAAIKLLLGAASKPLDLSEEELLAKMTSLLNNGVTLNIVTLPSGWEEKPVLAVAIRSLLHVDSRLLHNGNSQQQQGISTLSPFLLPLGDKKINNKVTLFEWDPKEERLPRSDRRNVLITAALPYVNNVPHLGNIIGAVLSADVFARYCRLRGYQTLYVCGTDEYGTATETKALEEGISCADLCAKYFKLHAAIYDWFGVSTDIFGRSSTPQQTAITHEIFKGLYDRGYFFQQSIEQTYCEGCSRFLADRYVEGTCPHCSYGDARGDQCDGCGKLLNPTELKEPRCKVCRKTPVVRSSNHLFLDLTKLQPAVEAFVEKQAVAGDWSTNSTSISRAWLTEGLKPRCMTRDLKWGTPVPLDDADLSQKVFYVWFDACIGYISITANYTEEWRQWWKSNDPSRKDAPVQLYQFMGKDNVPFHTVLFPSTLLGTCAGDDVNPWTLLHHINTTEYLNYENGKFSKSRCIGVFGNDARDSGIPASVWRYYLLSVRPETTDAAFSWDDFAARLNSELLANLGNFVSRVTKFATAKFDGRVPESSADLEEEVDAKFVAAVNAELKNYLEAMEGVHLKAALKSTMAISSLGNGYLTEAGLDNRLLASNPGRCAKTIAMALNLIYLLSAILEPFIPATSQDIRTILNAPAMQIPDAFLWDALQGGHVLGQPFHLFTRLDEVRVAELRARFAGKQQK